MYRMPSTDASARPKASEMKALGCIPPLMKGHFMKRGHFRKNWKSRFFVLELGRLSYFEKENSTGEPPYGQDLLKSLVLRNVGMSHHNDPTMISLADRLDKRDLLMQASSAEEADVWRKALMDHVMYALTYPNAALQLDHDEDDFRRSIAEALVADNVLALPGQILPATQVIGAPQGLCEHHHDEIDTFEFKSELPSPETSTMTSTSTSTTSMPSTVDQFSRPAIVRQISESVLDLDFTFEHQEVSVEEPEVDDFEESSTVMDKDLSSSQAHKVVHPDLVAIGKQLRQLEQESKRSQEASLKVWQKEEALRLKDAIKALDRKIDALRKEQKSALKNKTGFHSQFDETIRTLLVEQDALKLNLYFPNDPPLSFGSGGVYFSMDYFWLGNLAGKFRLKLSSSMGGSQLLFSLLGAADGEGIVVDITLGGFKLKSENTGIPSLTLDSVNLRVSLRVEILLSFLSNKHKWEASPENFVVQLLSFKGPFGISRSMVSALLSIAVPVIKSYVLEMLPQELGAFVSSGEVPLDVEGSFQVDGSVVVSELFHGMQKSPTICNILGYNIEQMLNFLALQKSLGRKTNIKSVIDLLRYRNNHHKQSQWDGIVRLWDQAALIYHEARINKQHLWREGEVRLSTLSFENYDDEDVEISSSAFYSFSKLLLGAVEVEKNPLNVRFSLETFRLDVSLGLMLSLAEEYYCRTAQELVIIEAEGTSVTEETKVYVAKMKQLCHDSQHLVADLGQLIHNLQFVFRMHVTSGAEGDVSVVAKDVCTQFPISFNVHMAPDSDSVFSPIVPTIKNIRTQEDGFISVKLFHLGSDDMLKKAKFLAFQNKSRLDTMLNSSTVADSLNLLDSTMGQDGDARTLQKRVLERYIAHCDRHNKITAAMLKVRPEKMSAVKIATLNVIRPRMSFIVNDLVTLQPGTALFIAQVGADDDNMQGLKPLKGRAKAHTMSVVKKYNRRRSTLLTDNVDDVMKPLDNFEDDEDLFEDDTLEEKGTPISLQGTNGLRTEAHVPELQFKGSIPKIMQFIAHHFDDIQLLADFFDETVVEATNRAAVKNKLLEVVGKHLLLPNFELLLNLSTKISAEMDDVNITCTTIKKYKHVLNVFFKVDFMELLNDWHSLMKTVVESEHLKLE